MNDPKIIRVYAHTCDHCGELMKSPEQMNRHLIEKHGYTMEAGDDDQFVYDEDNHVIYRPKDDSTTFRTNGIGDKNE